MQPEVPRRKPHHLANFDYSSPGAYFITICTAGRKCLLGKMDRDAINLTSIGSIVEECWTRVPDYLPSVLPDQHVVMPNHFHAIVMVGMTQSGLVTAKTTNSVSLQQVVHSFKAAVTKLARQHQDSADLEVWQSSYYDHVVRDEDDLYRIREYIQSNSRAWHLDRENERRSGLHPIYAYLDSCRNKPPSRAWIP